MRNATEEDYLTWWDKEEYIESQIDEADLPCLINSWLSYCKTHNLDPRIR